MIKKAILWDWWGGLLEAPTISLSSGVFTVSNTLASDANLSPVVDDVIITGTTTEDEVLTATPSARLRSPYAIHLIRTNGTDQIRKTLEHEQQL